ncbi:transcriptional adapter 2A [Colias croceus]|uniref:transcriptional adapter 2A n=1 Tax=Colias crocea TaxID=72248 RepID=UPI001E27AC13|nr:transcriptional adapter 2A [Colias croceus]
MSNDILQVKCDACSEAAHEPYIECCDCDTNLCCPCFSSGKEVGPHKSDHKYAVRRNDFPLFDNCNWSAKEECKLLSALSTYGYGNWEEISKSVHTRSKLECLEHYKKYYIENVQYDELKLLPETEQSLFPKPTIPYLYSIEISTNPPRNNPGDQHLAGYNAYRSEFELSYDQNAENIFNIEDTYSDDEDDCMDALKVSLANALNTRLKERRRRYKIIQNHGLIMPNKLLSWLKKFDVTITRVKAERLLSFMQFMTGMQFDAFMEAMSLEETYLQKISRLIEYRKNGIKTLQSARLYRHLKKENEAAFKEQKHFTSVMSKKYDSQSPVKNKLVIGYYGGAVSNKKYRKTSMPLDIVDMPSFHLLSENEKTLCSHVRLAPRTYLEIKNLLIAENNKLGFLRLLDARRIVKIDVNKTRKIYDYFIEEGFISKPLPNM